MPEVLFRHPLATNNTRSGRRAESFLTREQYHAGDPFVQCTFGAFSCLSSISPQGTRSYSASAYLEPVRLRENLHVLTNVHVDKVLIERGQNDGSATRAVGVQYTVHGAVNIDVAKKEVILAAGALQSPKILQFSGVGPSELLQRHFLDVVVDIPGVRRNLQGAFSFPWSSANGLLFCYL